MRNRIITVAALSALAGTAHAQVIEWDNALGGSWNDPANWSPMTIPNASSATASIMLPGAYTIDINQSVTVGTLSLSNPDAIVRVEVGDAISIDNAMLNNGELVVNNTAGGAVTTMFIRGGNTVISGTGSIRLNGFSTRALLTTTTNALLTNGPSHLIHGYGRIDAETNNQGTISADTAGQEISYITGPITNSGTISATNSATMNIGPLTLDQQPTARLLADGGTMLIGGLSITGGIVETTPGSLTRIDAPSTFDGVTLIGDTQLEIGDTLDVTNSLVNNGTFLINNNAGGAVTTLRFNDSTSLTGSGSVVLNGFSTRAQLLTADGVTMTHEATHTIEGYGRMIVTMVNHGPIIANVPNQEINIFSSSIDNTDTIIATNGGEIDIDNTTINNSGSGRLVTESASSLNLAAVTINNGQIETAPTGTTIISASSLFNGVSLLGDTTVEVGDTLTVTNGLVNNGTLVINNTAGGAITNLQFNDSTSLSGFGTTVLNGFSSRSQLLTAAGETMTIAQTVRGYGRVVGSFINDAQVQADVAGQAISIDSSTIDNNGLIAGLSDGTIDLNSSIIDNTGGEIRAGMGVVRIGSTNITGGQVNATFGGTVLVDLSSSFDGVTVGTGANSQFIIEIGDTLSVTNGLTNNGDIVVNNNAGAAITRLQYDESGILAGTGSVTLNGFSSRASLSGLDPAVAITQSADHTLLGQGLVSVVLFNDGTIAPGFPGTLPIRTMQASANIANTDSANYRVEVAGDNNADLIDSSAAYHADGTLTIELIDGFDPADYWSASIVQADNGITGRYDTIIAPPPTDTRLAIRARYLPDEIRIGAVCKPDIDFNGELNFFDISAFIALFNMQDPDADVAAPFGAWNFFDIATYIGQYNTGCP